MARIITLNNEAFIVEERRLPQKLHPVAEPVETIFVNQTSVVSTGPVIVLPG